MTESRMITTELMLNVRPDYLTVTPVMDHRSFKRSALQLYNQRNLRYNRCAGKISRKAATRLRTCINWLTAAAQDKWVYHKESGRRFKFKINLITLTLPVTDHDVSDHHFKSNLLRRFLDNCKYQHGLKNYVWKVEAQKNGNIHAHITTDCYIHYADIRKRWNAILRKEGLLRKFADRHGHSDPNSTDVKAVRRVNDVAAYLAKYMVKNDDDRRRIKGRLWYASESLLNVATNALITTPDDPTGVLQWLQSSGLPSKSIESKPDRWGVTKWVAQLYMVTRDILAGSMHDYIRKWYVQTTALIRGNGPPIGGYLEKEESKKHLRTI